MPNCGASASFDSLHPTTVSATGSPSARSSSVFNVNTPHHLQHVTIISMRCTTLNKLHSSTNTNDSLTRCTMLCFVNTFHPTPSFHDGIHQSTNPPAPVRHAPPRWESIHKSRLHLEERSKSSPVNLAFMQSCEPAGPVLCLLSDRECRTGGFALTIYSLRH